MNSRGIVGEVPHVDVRELKVSPAARDLLLTPIDRGSMDINPNIMSVFVEIVLKVQRHLPATATDIENAFVRLQSGDRSQVTHELRARRLETSQRPDVPA